MSDPRPPQDQAGPPPTVDVEGETTRPSLFAQMAHPDLSVIPAEEIAAAEVTDYPGVNEHVEEGAVPISRRLRNPRTIVSIVLPIVVLLLLAVALPGFHLDQLPSLILNANPWWLLAAVALHVRVASAGSCHARRTPAAVGGSVVAVGTMAAMAAM